MRVSIILAFGLLIAFPFLAGAQQVTRDHVAKSRMRSIGPAVMSGRVTAIDVAQAGEPVLWIGTASGGVWKSENQGLSWSPVFDGQEVLGIGALKVDPTNPDVIWVGTGEGNPRNSQTSGRGIYRSPDAGKTWQCMGLEDTKAIHRICVDPRNSHTVFAAALGSAWGAGPGRGVYRTRDGGKSWSRVLFTNDSAGCADLLMDPHNPDKLFAAMWQYQRRSWFFSSGGRGSGLYVTVDGGSTWKQLTDKDGLPKAPWGRTGVAIAPGNPKVVYALIEAEKSALYRSTDGGYSWSMVNDRDVGDRPFYYHELYVDPSNANHLIYLHSVVSESIDGGKTWTTLLPYAGVHPDHHAFWWSAKDPRFMVEGNDGGLNISRDGGRNWQFVGNLPLGQFYHINYDLETPYHIYGGLQDNGSWKGPGYVWHSDGILGSDWQEVLFGDGFDVVPDPRDSRFVYAMAQGGYLCRVDTRTGEQQFIQPVHPDGLKLRFHWNSAISADPHRPGAIYYGSQHVHLSRDGGQSWEIISPDLTSNDTTRQHASESGGLTIDATSAENYCTILTIAPSPVDSSVIWVGTDDGRVQLTRSGGKSWTSLSSAIRGFPSGGWIPQIVASQRNPGEAWVVVNNYRQDDWRPYLFYTSDYGVSWKNLVQNKDISGHCLSVAPDPVEPALIFLGTEHGLYYTTDAGSSWSKWTHEYPPVATQDLLIHPVEHDLIIGTFGRAIYVLDDIRPLRRLAAEGDEWIRRPIAAMDSPVARQVFLSRHPGERFPGDGRFIGENKPSSAVLSYWYNPAAESESASSPKPVKSAATDLAGAEGEKEQKVRIAILDSQRDTVRWFRHEPDSGLNILTWNYDSQGVRPLSRDRPKKDEDPPGGGLQVPPGRYWIVYRLGKWADSTLLHIEFDPRVPFDSATYQEQSRLYAQWAETAGRAADAFGELMYYRRMMDLVSRMREEVPVQDTTGYAELCGKLESSIQKASGLFMLPEETTGIRDDEHLISNRLGKVREWISTGTASPGQNGKNALEQLRQQVGKAAEEVNTLTEGPWKHWRNRNERDGIALFREDRKF